MKFKIIFLLVCIIICLSSCISEEYKIEYEKKMEEVNKLTYSERELCDVSLYSKAQTNQFGGVAYYENYLRFSYITKNENIKTLEDIFPNNYHTKPYKLKKSDTDKSKIVIRKRGNIIIGYDLYLSKQHYSNLYKK